MKFLISTRCRAMLLNMVESYSIEPETLKPKVLYRSLKDVWGAWSGSVLHPRGHGSANTCSSTGQGDLARRHTDGPLWSCDRAALLKKTVMCKAWRRCTALVRILLNFFLSTVRPNPNSSL